jgi:hypothetical protein
MTKHLPILHTFDITDLDVDDLTDLIELGYLARKKELKLFSTRCEEQIFFIAAESADDVKQLLLDPEYTHSINEEWSLSEITELSWIA